MEHKSITMTITERYEMEALSNVFGEEDLFGLECDEEVDQDIIYELEVEVRRIRRIKI